PANGRERKSQTHGLIDARAGLRASATLQPEAQRISIPLRLTATCHKWAKLNCHRWAKNTCQTHHCCGDGLTLRHRRIGCCRLECETRRRELNGWGCWVLNGWGCWVLIRGAASGA